MKEKAIEYFKFNRKIYCEDHLKILPKDSIAYQATLKEKEFYDIAINALEQDWIPCSKRLPEEKINPITQDFYGYQCTFKNKDVYDVRTYKFGKSHWWHGLSIMDNYVIAWRESPEPYKPKKSEDDK